MKKINKYNYEAFYLDYLENDLKEEQISMLLHFLEQNPELKAGLTGFENIRLGQDPNKAVFNNHLLLKRDEKSGLSKMDLLMIGSAEGTLNSKELKQLTKLMLDPKIEAETLSYQKIKLKEDRYIIYKNKNNLKKSGNVFWKYTFRYAAAAAIFISLFFFQKNSAVQQYQLRKTKLTVSDNLQEEQKETKELNQIAVEIPMNTEAVETIDKNFIAHLPVKGISQMKYPISHSPKTPSLQTPANRIILEDQILLDKNATADLSLSAGPTEYQKLPELVFGLLNKKLFDDQLFFSQKKTEDAHSIAFHFADFEFSHTKSE